MQPAYAPGPRRAQGRATDRRRGAGELLRTVTSGLNATREVARVRERFEEELRALMGRSCMARIGRLPLSPSVATARTSAKTADASSSNPPKQGGGISRP